MRHYCVLLLLTPLWQCHYDDATHTMWASFYEIVFVRFFEDGCQNWTLDWRREEGQVLRSGLLMGLLRIVRNMTLSWGKRDHSGDDLPSSVFVCLAYFSTHLLPHLVQQICSDDCVQYFTIFSSSSCLRKKSTHIAKTWSATLIYMHLLSYHASIVVATTRWIFYQVAFLHRDMQFLPFIYTSVLFQSFK
jgi:hypothetical protein